MSISGNTLGDRFTFRASTFQLFVWNRAAHDRLKGGLVVSDAIRKANNEAATTYLGAARRVRFALNRFFPSSYKGWTPAAYNSEWIIADNSVTVRPRARGRRVLSAAKASAASPG